MGCDIHTHLEIKIDGKWHHDSSPSISRNYDLFAKMAGVRAYGNSIVPISKPRGTPQDISAVTALDLESWNGDAHSNSWLNADEIKEIIDYHVKSACDIPDYIPEEQVSKYIYEKGNTDATIRRNAYDIRSSWGYVHGHHLSDFKEYKEELPSKLEDIRLVFWFDN